MALSEEWLRKQRIINQRIINQRIEYLLYNPSSEFKGFSIRIIKAFAEAGICNIEDCIKKTKREMLKMKNFGAKSLSDVIDFLEKRGIKHSFNNKDVCCCCCGQLITKKEDNGTSCSIVTSGGALNAHPA